MADGSKFVDIVILILFVSRCHIESVTILDPCDPLRENVVARSVLRKAAILNAETLKVLPTWLTEPLRYVNCSRRGLNRIPATIPSNVQHLDLSSNVIGQLDAKELERFADLQILILYSNCIGSSPISEYFCQGIRGIYDDRALVLS